MSESAIAAVFDGPGKPMQLREFPHPQPTEGEISVRVRMATICGSDLHSIEGRRAVPCPTILGHEILGIIEQMPTPTQDLAGQTLAVGDRIVWSMLVSCGNCFFCTQGLPQKCERLFKYGHEAITPDHALHGGLATHCLLKIGSGLVRVPDSLPDAAGCPASCATATIAAALRHAGQIKGAVVVIQGAGMLGLTACAWAQTLGARGVVLTDPRVDRLEMGRRFGATHVVSTSDSPQALQDEISRLTSGRGADVVLELSGATSAVQAGIELLRPGGTAVWVGAVYPGAALNLPAERVVRKHLSIHGVHNYLPADLLSSIDFLAKNHDRFPFAELVSHPFSLKEVENAVEHARRGRSFRVAVVPNN